MSPSRAIENRISLASGAGGRISPLSFISAALLHVLIVAATLFTFAHKLDLQVQDSPVVPVDLVTIGEKTNIRAMVKEQPKAPPKEEPTPAPPTPQPMVTPPQTQQEAAPDEAPSEPLIAKPEPAPMPVPRPVEKPKPQSKKQQFDINNIMALLNKQAPAASSAKNAKVANRNVKGAGLENAMTADLQDALRSQIAQCWSPPVGAPNAQDLVVDFDLVLNPDGSVAQPPQLVGDSASAASGNPFTRAAAEAARRAIYECAPYKLPGDRYSQWREINPFHFDPRQMMGQ